MDAATFTELALRVIAREASDEDRRALEAELAATPPRRDEFEQMRIAHDVLRLTAPALEATHATGPELPAHRVGELRTVVRQHFGPAVSRYKAESGSPAFKFILRWIFGGTGVAALGLAVAVACLANRTVEIGLYGSDQVRGGSEPLAQADVPSARIVAFDRDEPFDHWQAAPLAWNERAKIWIDNERDLIHIKRRVHIGQVVMETRPLAPTNEGERAQLRDLVLELER